ncbi:unnamed protein product [Blepharisma stoltei]|uniref:Palmitoyltransferase n=1 Tax=Blepharisma stoltei TaxID=1481888 RepID=A0AAU9K392_9CILI|nr:unnamed protein product [Blepharisma stoltei]
MEIDNKKRRSRLNFYQVLSWILISLNVTFSYALTIKLLDTIYDIYFLALYSTTLGVIVILAIYIGYSDPTSDSVRLSWEYRDKGIELDCSKYPVKCNVCDAYVENTTKHCFTCNQCIEKFDHHCKWLNNCIGSKNYKSFIILSFSCAVHFTIETIFNSLLINYYIQNSPKFENKCSDNLNANYKIILAFVIICVLQSFLVALSFFYLIGFHIYLARLGLTTYDFIMKRREIAIPEEHLKIETVKDYSIFEQNSPVDLEKTQGNKTHLQSDTSLRLIERAVDEN